MRPTTAFGRGVFYFMKLKLFLVALVLSLALVFTGPIQAYAAGQLPHWDDELLVLITIDPKAKRLVQTIKDLESQLFSNPLESKVLKVIESINLELPSQAYIAAILAVLPFKLAQTIKNWAVAIVAYLNYVNANGSFVRGDYYSLTYQLNDDARLRLSKLKAGV